MNKIPFDETTNYPDVLRVTKQMFSDIVARGTKCCQAPNVKDALCIAKVFVQNADFDNSTGQQDKYEHAVKGAYLTLYPLSGDADYNYQPLP